MKIDSSQKTITREQALRGIYFDFEAFKAKSPYLIGLLCDDMFDQRVLDPSLEPAAQAKALPIDDLDSVVAELVARSELEDRYLIAFTQHERRLIDEFVGRDIGPRYKDARFLAKKWLNREQPGHGEPNALKPMLELIGYARPSHLGDRKQTKRVRALRQGLETNRVSGDHSKLTTTQKGGWTKVLDHNRVDCYGVRALVFETLGLPWTHHDTTTIQAEDR
jgi:hypothetical protein